LESGIFDIIWGLPTSVKMSIFLLILGIIFSFFKKMLKLGIMLSILAILVIVIVKMLSNS
jgi:hypothetical protein